MTNKEARDILKHHQLWRKGADIYKIDVLKLTKAIDKAIKVLHAEADKNEQSDNLIKHNRNK